MPYIMKSYRDNLEPELQTLIIKLQREIGAEKDLVPSLIAYCLMKIIVHTCPRKYASMASVIGAIESTKHEFMRRHLDWYEDGKLRENGDV